MGYMGFGMRKEVYTRKPKKVFENWPKFKSTSAFVSEFRGRVGNKANNYTLKFLTRVFIVTLIITIVVLVYKLFIEK